MIDPTLINDYISILDRFENAITVMVAALHPGFLHTGLLGPAHVVISDQGAMLIIAELDTYRYIDAPTVVTIPVDYFSKSPEELLSMGARIIEKTA